MQENELMKQIRGQMEKIGKALLQLYKFQGAVWTDIINPDEGLIMTCEGVSALLTTLCFEGNEEFKKKVLGNKIERNSIKGMLSDIYDVADKRMDEIPSNTSPYLDFLKTSGKTGEGMQTPELASREALEKMKLNYTESVYSFAKTLWYISKANLPEDIPQDTLNNCRIMIDNLLKHNVHIASKIQEPKIKIVGWSYTNASSSFDQEDIEENNRQYLIPYYTFNTVNFVFNVLSMNPDTDTRKLLDKYNTLLIDLYGWIKDNFFSEASKWNIEKEPIIDFGNLLLEFGDTGFPLYNNVYILSTFILILAFQKKRGQNLDEVDKNLQKRIEDALIYVANEITEKNKDYQWDPVDDTIGEHMFRLAGELWQAPREGKTYHKKVFIDRSIYPMMLKAVSLYGTVFEENMDEVLQPLLIGLFEMQIKEGRYIGMWHGRSPSIYYTNRVVDALVNLSQYAEEVESSLDFAKIIKESRSLPTVPVKTGVRIEEKSVQVALDAVNEFTQKMKKAFEEIPVPDLVHKESIKKIVKEELEDYKFSINKKVKEITEEITGGELELRNIKHQFGDEIKEINKQIKKLEDIRGTEQRKREEKPIIGPHKERKRGLEEESPL